MGGSPDRGQSTHEAGQDPGKEQRTARRFDFQPEKAKRHGEEHAQAENGREGIRAQQLQAESGRPCRQQAASQGEGQILPADVAPFPNHAAGAHGNCHGQHRPRHESSIDDGEHRRGEHVESETRGTLNGAGKNEREGRGYPLGTEQQIHHASRFQQAAKWSPDLRRSCGSSLRHRSLASGQRG